MEITPLILTYNEAPNIRRTLERLTWAAEIVVVDSFSTDATLDILKSFPQVRVVQRKFDTFAGQCNFGLDQILTPWVLSLDADYVLSPELVEEMKVLEDRGRKTEVRGQRTEDSRPPASDLRPLPSALRPLSSAPCPAGYRVRFRYCIHGRPLRASLYPPRTILYLKERARYRDEGHGHRVEIDGPVRMLSGYIDHDDRKPLDRWFNEQLRYSAQEARHLLETPRAALNRADRVRRRVLLAPVLVFFYTLLAKGLVLDGWAGWYYVLQRTLAEMMLSLRLLEKRAEDRGQRTEDRRQRTEGGYED